MAWRIERWSADLYRPDVETIEQYRPLPIRELVIVGCATLDAALAELISARLIEDERESTDFLGADEDGRAPAGSFGARIQLAYLLGIIPKPALQSFRALKALRNIVAHRVAVDVVGPKCQATLEPLRQVLSGVEDDGDRWSVVSALQRSRSDADAFRYVVLLSLASLQSGLHMIAKRLTRVGVSWT